MSDRAFGEETALSRPWQCSESTLIRLAHTMLRIRMFEERALSEFSKGSLFGTTHTCIGQEADAVGVVSSLRPDDVVVSNHRGHGHYLAWGGDMRALAAEMMGRKTGVCGGIGGSQHLHIKNFYSNGVQGGTLPLAVGIAAAEKVLGSGAIVCVFLGDGTLGEGAVYEGLNVASLWRLPVLFVVENNRYAQTTPIASHLAGTISGRFRAFGIEVAEIESTDALEIMTASNAISTEVRANSTPAGLILNTYRLAPHSKGDDFRDLAEIERYRLQDPIAVMRPGLTPLVWSEVFEKARLEVDQAFEQAASDEWADATKLSGFSVQK